MLELHAIGDLGQRVHACQVANAFLGAAAPDQEAARPFRTGHNFNRIGAPVQDLQQVRHLDFAAAGHHGGLKLQIVRCICGHGDLVRILHAVLTIQQDHACARPGCVLVCHSSAISRRLRSAIAV